MSKSNSQSRCCIKGCDRNAVYKGKQLCQKHYFRQRRNGHYGKKRRERRDTEWRGRHSNGYVLLHKPSHPLANARGLFYEHRAVAYEKYGSVPPPCALCGVESSWESKATHVDHIDCDKENNDPENIRILCLSCNTGRNPEDVTKRPSAMVIDHAGEKLTTQQWARMPGVSVCGTTIRSRIKKGWSPESAIYTPSKTRKAI